MKLKTGFLIVLLFSALFLHAQVSKVINVPFSSTIIVDPETIDPSALLNGFYIENIDGTNYFKIFQDGWANWTNIPEAVVPEGATHLKFQAKFEEGSSGLPIDRAIISVKLTSSDWNVVFGNGGGSASTVLKEYQMPVLEHGTAQILQAAVMDNSDWSGVTGAIQYIGKIEAIANGNANYNLTYGSAASDKTIQIASELSWTITSDQTWLTLNKTSGSGTDNIVLTAASNNTDLTRDATVTIHTDGFDDQYINISQYGAIVITAGNLKTILADQLDFVTGFKLTGTIDARDFKTMRDDMPMLADIDLGEVSIVEYSGTVGTVDGDNIYLNDVIPNRAFCPADNSGKPGLKNIIFPNTIISIGLNAFRNCTGLTSIAIPSTVTKIDNQAFLYCSGLSNVAFEANSQLNAIGRYTFGVCTGLQSITLPSLVEIIDLAAFYNCSGLSEIVFESNQNLTTIGNAAFIYCSNLTSFSVFQNVTSIGNIAFVGTNAEIHVDEGNQNYTDEEGVLYDILKTRLIFCPPSKSGYYYIPNSVTSIAQSAFYNCSEITAFHLPSNLDVIESWAFENCSGLNSISIPASVTLIDNNAFYNCTNLTSLNAYPLSPVDLSSKENVFFGIDKTNCTLNVPRGSKAAYQAAALWQDFENINELLEIILTGGSITSDNETLQIQTQILPEDASDKRLIWYLKKTDGSAAKASISAEGLITPLLDEEIIVWASSFDGLALSNEVSVSISGQNLTVQDLNIIKNGDFNLVDEETSMAYFWGGYTDASPAHQIIDGVSVHSPVGADNLWQYQFSQINLTALPNVDYIFSFTAWADADRTFTVDFEDSPANNYNRYGVSADPRTTNGDGRSDWTFDITTVPTTYTFDVNFDQITETTVQMLGFMLGTSNIPVYIDDVVLISVADLDLISTNSDHITLKRTPVAPQIDGVADDIWDKISAVPIGKNFLGESPTVVASWKAMYDDNNIYLLINVQDDDHYPAWEAGDGSFWEYDQPEVFFDVNNELLDGAGPSSLGSGHWVFSSPLLENEYGTPQANDLAAPVTWCYTLLGENYQVEYAFPFNSLTQNGGTVLDVNGFKALGSFGFDITIDDRDALKDSRDRKVWQNIGEQAEAYLNMDDCGTISLGDEEIISDFVSVTFLVDMQNEVVDEAGVFVVGDWNSSMSWTEPVQLTADGNVYSTVIEILKGKTFNYKFKNGDTWETITGNCSVGENGDRIFSVGDVDAVLDLVCFGSCTSCSDPNIPTYTIREIQGEGDVSPLNGQVVRTKGRITGMNQFGCFIQDATDVRSGIYIYNPNLQALFSQNDEIQIIATVSEYNGRTQLSGTQWVDYADESFVLYLSQIEVSEIDEDYEGVFVALNNVTVLSQDQFQEYIVISEQGDTAIIDNFLIQPVMEIGVKYNVFGIVDYQNGKYKVNPRAETGLIRLSEVTFQVDMQNETVSPNGVHINGSFSNWAEAVEMLNDGGSVYSATLTLPVGGTYTYKFINGGTTDWDNYENPPEKCTVGENNDREIVVSSANLTLDVVCFNSCYSCDKQDQLHVTLKKTPVAPNIDGIPDKIWEKVEAVSIDEYFISEVPTLQATWKAMYDDNNIYVLVEVEDDDHYPAWEAGGNSWEYDQVEVYFDVNNQLLDGIGPANSGSGHWTCNFAMLENEYGIPQEGFLAATVSWCYVLTGENYRVEYAIPFNSLTQNDGTVLDVNGFKDLEAFGFDVTITDRDVLNDTRRRKVWQNYGLQNESYFNMDDCGTISLGNEEIIIEETQQIFLSAGWNIISLCIMPENDNLKDNLQSLIEKDVLIKVMDEVGDVIEKRESAWVNNINGIECTEGYKIKVSSNSTIELTGVSVQLPFEIPLTSGWNIISWPLSEEQNALVAFDDLIDEGQLVKVMNEKGDAIEKRDGVWFNGIINLMPGEGYKVKVSSNCILTVNENVLKSEEIKSETIASTHFIPAYIGNGTDHMNIYLMNIVESGIIAGDEIGVFDGGICVGSVKVSNLNSKEFGASISIPVSAADGIDFKNGYSNGNPIKIKLYREGKEYPVLIEPLDNVAPIFKQGSSLFAEIDVKISTGIEGLISTELVDVKCYPNPFSKELTVEFSLLKESEVLVEVLNLLGQRVKTLEANKQLPNGRYLIKWNGSDNTNRVISPGIYLVNIVINNVIHHRKIVFSN